MKYLLISLILFAMPSIANADDLPANYMILRGKVYNLDHLWGKGVAPVATVATQLIAQPIPQEESREVRNNNQRVAYENARTQILIERLNNMR